MKLIGFIESESLRERRCGPVLWIEDLSALPHGTKIYAALSAQREQPQGSLKIYSKNLESFYED